MTLALDIEQLAEVRTILAAHLPQGVRVRAFGSRATQGGMSRVRAMSDLDLVLDGGDPLPLSLLSTLIEAFDESALPFKVDVIDRRTVTEAFGAIVDASSLPLPL